MQRTQSEQDFFQAFVDRTPDGSRPVFIPKGDINSPAYAQPILEAAPDLLVAYGCSIVREPLISAFAGRFVNLHLGLSPYYRGSGTNYWPLVNGEPEYAGATFMHLDAGVDTGEIIHQLRARIVWGDMPAQIGNRLIVDAAYACAEIIRQFPSLPAMPPVTAPERARVYRKKDFTEESVARLYANFQAGLVERYLAEQAERDQRVPILVNPGLAQQAAP
jgi:methionyl-tRNA formyltransferase